MDAPNTQHAAIRVLVAEDDPDIGALLALVLRPAAAVTVVPDAEAALELLETGERFDLIVSDYGLPGLCGVEFVERLRESGARATPVLMISGHVALDDGMRARAAGIEAFLCKPFSMSVLRRTVGRLIGGAERRTEVGRFLA